MRNFTTSSKVTRVSNAVAAGVTVVNSASVDMKGFSGVTFMCHFGAIVAGAILIVHAQQSADNSNWSDLAGTGKQLADTDDNRIWLLEVEKPRERFVRVVVTRSTQNTTIDAITAIQKRATEEPVTQDATTVAGFELHLAPAEGTPGS